MRNKLLSIILAASFVLATTCVEVKASDIDTIAITEASLAEDVFDEYKEYPMIIDEEEIETSEVPESDQNEQDELKIEDEGDDSSFDSASMSSEARTEDSEDDVLKVDTAIKTTSVEVSKLTITGLKDITMPLDWDGKSQEPFAQKLTIKYKGKTVPAKGYKVTASEIKGIGKAKITVKGTGKAVKISGKTYKFTGTKTLSFKVKKPDFKYSYGVFLGYEGKISKLKNYETVVIDVQSSKFTKKDIANFKKTGHKVYSYINVGALENTRDYYDKYKSLALGKYEHWDEEVWIDVSKSKWQKFILNELAPMMIDKGIDGFFVDNCDVYYNYPKKKIYNGLTVIMKGLVATGKKVIINGGDCYLDKYCSQGGVWSDVITGINQESVFSAIDWENGVFVTADPEDHEYFISYIERYGNQGAEIFLLEYTKDKKLISKIKKYCKKKGYEYYISDSLGLTYSASKASASAGLP